jgi:hypothetical protein
MTALVKDIQRVEKEGKLLAMPVKGGVVCFKNALMMIGADGYVKPCISEAGASFAGMAYERVTATDASDGDLSIRLERQNAIYVAGAGFVQADLGKEVYAADDNTVQLAAGTNLVKVGVIVEVASATSVLVKMNTNIAK